MMVFDRHTRNGPGGGSGYRGVPANLLGARLRELREAAGLNQCDVANMLGTGANRISNHELGVNIPTLQVLVRYAAVHHCTVSDLLYGVL